MDRGNFYSRPTKGGERAIGGFDIQAAAMSVHGPAQFG
jgi:hypothetical protein